MKKCKCKKQTLKWDEAIYNAKVKVIWGFYVGLEGIVVGRSAAGIFKNGRVKVNLGKDIGCVSYLFEQLEQA